MSELRKLNRRDFLARAAALGAAATAGGMFIAACNSGGGGGGEGGGGGGGLDCTDTSGLDDSQIALRNGVAYVDASSTDGQNCANCSLYTAAGDGECGGCTTVPGPINPDGWCTTWAAAA